MTGRRWNKDEACGGVFDIYQSCLLVGLGGGGVVLRRPPHAETIYCGKHSHAAGWKGCHSARVQPRAACVCASMQHRTGQTLRCRSRMQHTL